MKEKFKSAFDCYDDNSDLFATWYKIIKNELKDDYRKVNLKANDNDVVMRFLNISESYIQLKEPINSKKYSKMRRELSDSWYYLVYYIEEIKSTDI